MQCKIDMMLQGLLEKDRQSLVKIENEIIQDKDVSAWLSECRTKATRNAYTYASNLFFNWLQKEKNISLEQFKALSSKDMKHLVLARALPHSPRPTDSVPQKLP